MNLFEENRATLLTKLSQDNTDNFTSPVIKSKTPIPKRISKETLKIHKKQTVKRSNTQKTEKSVIKSNTNAIRESSNNHFKRAKNKGSVSVELFNGSKEMQRPHSVISKSFFNHLELAHKVKSLSKPSGQLNIERIIKKSLLKAKSNKLNKEKDQKHYSIQNEIRRQELKYQNIQIRKQNGKSAKKKGKKRQKKTNSSGKLLEQPRSIQEVASQPKNYLNKVQETYLRNYGKSVEGRLDLLGRKDFKESNSFEELSDIHANEVSDESGEGKIFSFIRTEEVKGKVKNREDNFGDGQLSRSLDLSIQRQEYLQEDHKEKTDSLQKVQKKTMSLCFQTQSSLKITKTPVTLSTFTSSISILPQPKPVLKSNLQTQVSITSTPPQLSQSFHSVFSHRNSNTLTPTTTQSLSPSSNTQYLIDQVSEELSSTLSSLFLIEQLKLSELSTFADLSKLLPLELRKNIMLQIENKFTSIISFLQPDIELRIAKYVAKLSQQQGSEFLQKTQKKKKELHKFLNEIKVSEKATKKIANENESGSSSSSDEAMQALGISHSRSVIRLHEELYSASEIKGAEIDFGFKEISPDQSFPVLNLELKPVECEAVEIRKVFTTDTILKYTSIVMQSLSKDKLIQELQQPLVKDPLDELDKIQDLQIGTFTESEIYNFEQVLDYNECMKIELHGGVSECKNKETQKVENIYKGLVLDCINYLLQQFRPYGYHGKPFPWSEFHADLRMKKLSFEFICEKILEDLRSLNEFCIGKHEDVESSELGDENSILKFKEKQLDCMIHYEVKAEEEKWLNYEFEEAQVKIDLADVILYELITEVININNMY